MTQLNSSTLGEICDKVNGIIRTGPFGSQLHESDYVQEGIPVVMPKNIVDGKVSVEDIARIDETNVERLAQHKLHSGDIVYGRRGDIGRRALISRKEEGWLCGTGCLRISLGDSLLNPLFLYYYLGQPNIIKWIFNQAIGATLPNLNTEIIRSIQVKYPPLQTQQKIAAILSAYDDLIENNTRRIAILEEMAQSLYREWFVHFRFPGHEKKSMVESALGMIPEGWEVKSLFEAAKLSKEGINPGKYQQEVFEHYSIPAFDSGCMPAMDTGEEIKSNKFLVPKDSILLSKINPRIPRVWLPMFISAERTLASTEFLVILPKTRYSREFLFSTFRTPEFMDRFVGRAGGTSTSHQRVKPDDLMSLLIIWPDKTIIDAFAHSVLPMFQSIHNLRIKNANLRQTRDLLLPKLISGEVDVEELEVAGVGDR